MRQTLSRGMVAAAAATGVLSLCGSPVFADSAADGSTSGSPGVASGNTVQVPVHVPINVCGNTVNVVALLNPAFGNTCANGTAAPAAPAPVTPAPAAPAPATPTPAAPTVPAQTPRDTGSSSTSGHVGSGNTGNHTGSGTTSNHTGTGVSSHTPSTGQSSHQSGNSAVPPQRTQHSQTGTSQVVVPQAEMPHVAVPAGTQHVAAPLPAPAPALAETGSEGVLAASAVSVAMLAGGLILYRRGRVTARR